MLLLLMMMMMMMMGGGELKGGLERRDAVVYGGTGGEGLRLRLVGGDRGG